jgi:hypothetical protein
MKMRRRALSVLLTLAMVFTFMPFVSQQAFAASKTKVQLVTQAKDDDGNTTTYSYNKKGLVTKAVTKSSSKGEDYDSSTVVTTTFKYNKKNRIAKETTKTVETETYYDTNKTTGKFNGVKTGSVTTTTTDVTNYTYKKGVAKKAVTTTTKVMAGSMTSTEKFRDTYSDDSSKAFYGDELAAGGIVAGFNEQRPDGTFYDKDTAENAFYYTGAVNDATGEVTTVTTYTDNGNGTYKVTEEETTAFKGVRVEREYAYYMKNESGAYVECTKDDDWDFTRVKEAKIVPINDEDYSSASSSVKKEETTISDKEVTTTTYSNKKKAVKKAVTTTVSTLETVSGPSSSSYSATYSDGTVTSSTVDNAVNKMTSTTTNTETATYSYKKGKAVKKTVTDPGVKNFTITTTRGLPNYTTTYQFSGYPAETTTVSGTGAEYRSIETTTAANGTVTTTSQLMPYTMIYNGAPTQIQGTTPVTKVKAVKAEPSKSVTTYKYDKNGNMKKATSKDSDTSTESQKNETFGNQLYVFGLDGTLEEATVSVVTNSTFVGKFVNTVKTGTKRLKECLGIYNSKSGRSSSTGYKLGRWTYKLKAKSFSKKAAKNAELQQWIIQNGGLNGVVGL